MEDKNEKIIIIEKNGPYTVKGGIPLSEKVIRSESGVNRFVDGRHYPLQEEYSLCRCGKTKDAPYCDKTHELIDFDGTETASKKNYRDRAAIIEGEGINLMDDGRCAFARFCHRKGGDAWELTEQSGNAEARSEAVQAACDCPAGRLVVVDKNGNVIEPKYEPSIEILQDPEKYCSGGIFVKGGIPIVSADGEKYEIRNRVDLCRCGQSFNKPFCDATHVSIEFSDEQKDE